MMRSHPPNIYILECGHWSSLAEIAKVEGCIWRPNWHEASFSDAATIHPNNAHSPMQKAERTICCKIFHPLSSFSTYSILSRFTFQYKSSPTRLDCQVSETTPPCFEWLFSSSRCFLERGGNSVAMVFGAQKAEDMPRGRLK